MGHMRKLAPHYVEKAIPGQVVFYFKLKHTRELKNFFVFIDMKGLSLKHGLTEEFFTGKKSK